MIAKSRWLALLVLSLFGCGNQTSPEAVVIPTPAAADKPVTEAAPVAAAAVGSPADTSSRTRKRGQEPAPKAASADKKEPPPDRFADSAKLLSQLTAPSSFRVPLPQTSCQPLPPAQFTSLELRPAPPLANAVRLAMPSPIASKPASLPERVPADFAALLSAAAERLVLPVDELTKIDAPDVTERTPLPALARPSVDRASFDDPTADFTAQSIVASKLPERSIPAPFVKVNLPDPFENVEAAKVKTTMKDDPLTAIGNQPVPQP